MNRLFFLTAGLFAIGLMAAAPASAALVEFDVPLFDMTSKDCATPDLAMAIVDADAFCAMEVAPTRTARVLPERLVHLTHDAPTFVLSAALPGLPLLPSIRASPPG